MLVISIMLPELYRTDEIICIYSKEGWASRAVRAPTPCCVHRTFQARLLQGAERSERACYFIMLPKVFSSPIAHIGVFILTDGVTHFHTSVGLGNGRSIRTAQYVLSMHSQPQTDRGTCQFVYPPHRGMRDQGNRVLIGGIMSRTSRLLLSCFWTVAVINFLGVLMFFTLSRQFYWAPRETVVNRLRVFYFGNEVLI